MFLWLRQIADGWYAIFYWDGVQVGIYWAKASGAVNYHHWFIDFNLLD